MTFQLQVLDEEHATLLAGLTRRAPQLLGRSVDLTAWLATPSGGDAFGWVHGCGAVRLVPNTRIRQRHGATIELCAEDGAAELLERAVQFADAWTPQDRLELSVPAGHPALPAAESLGFQIEIRQRARHLDGRDGLLLARLRPGFSPRPARAFPTHPPRGRRQISSLTLVAPTPDDAARIRELSVLPSTLYGTLQNPGSSRSFYRQRHERMRTDDRVFLIVADGELAGMAGLHPTGVQGVGAVGLMIAPDLQGCGLGKRTMDKLIDEGRTQGLRRLELGVVSHNERAIALYCSRGFVDEGERRADSILDGGHSNSRDMALSIA